jgi:ubiquinone/menaquinone biosynthesis C-methylase UbiE
MSNILSRTGEEIGYWMHGKWTLDSVGEFWDGVAEEYDALNARTVSYFRRFIESDRLAEFPRDSRVLDYCSRSGNGTLFFHGRGVLKNAVCADFSAGMGDVLKRKFDEAGFTDYDWLQTSTYELPFPDDSFDIVLCLETVEHVDDPGRLIREVTRLARPGATVVISTPNVLWEPVHAGSAIVRYHHSEGPHRFIRNRRLRKLILAAGLEIQSHTTSVLAPGGPKWAIRIGDWVEARTRRTLMPIVGLRRMYVCRKPE